LLFCFFNQSSFLWASSLLGNISQYNNFNGLLFLVETVFHCWCSINLLCTSFVLQT
jgi:hypothetical protein